MASIAEINIRIGATIEGMVKGLKQAEKELAASGRKMQALGDSLSSTVSLPLIGIGVAGAKMAGDLSDNFSKIENLVGVTGKTLESFADGVKDLSGKVGKSQAELSEALFTVTSAGLRGSEALDVLDASAKASVIGMGSTRDIAQATTAVITAYGIENISAAEAVNLLTKTVKEGNLEASELAPTIGKLLPLASQMGVSFEEVGANIATFTRLGVKAPEAVSALKALLSNLIKPSTEAKESLAAVGLSVEQLQASIKNQGLSATLQELVKIYGNNTEGIAKLFGSVEGLANVFGTAGAQGETYTQILTSMKDGTDIVNAGFENASKKGPEVFRQSLVKLQNVMIDVGNVVIPFATQVAEQIAFVATAFGSLSESTQKYIVIAAGIVAAIGPALKIYGVLLSTMSAVKGAQIVAAENFKKLSGSVLSAASSFQKMDLVMKASVLGAIVATVGLAIAAYNSYSSTLTTAQKVQNEINDVHLRASQAIVQEKIESERLVAVIGNVNASYEEKKAALGELQRIAPDYFGDLNREKFTLEEVQVAQKNYIENLKQMAKVQAAQDRLVELNKKLLDSKAIVEEASPGILGYAKAWAATQVGGGNFIQVARTKAVADTTDEIEQQIDALTNLIATEKKYVANQSSGPANNTFTNPEAPTLSSVQTGAFDSDTISKQKEAIKTAMEEMAASTEALNVPTTKLHINKKILNDQLKDVPDRLNAIQEALEPTIAKWAGLNDELGRIMETGTGVQQVMGAAAGAMVGAAKSGETSFKKIGAAALKGAADVIRAKMMEAVAAYVADSFAKFGILGAIVAAGAGAVVGGLFNVALSKIAPPALAQGGLAYGPTLATVGDNRNASVDPEVISPLSKLKSIIGNSNQGPVSVMGSVRVKGSDLLIMIENAEKEKERRG